MFSLFSLLFLLPSLSSVFLFQVMADMHQIKRTNLDDDNRLLHHMVDLAVDKLEQHTNASAKNTKNGEE